MTRIETKRYQKVSEWVSDVELIWENAITYNADGSPLHLIALEMQQWFRKRISAAPWNQEQAAFLTMAKAVRKLSNLAAFPSPNLLKP